MNKSFIVLINKLFEARQMAHNEHLRTKKYSAHKALDGFYSDILDMIDQLVEVYQGEFGITEFATQIKVEQVDIIQYLESVAKMLKGANGALKDSHSHYKNILDEMTALTYRTIYKLKFLS